MATRHDRRLGRAVQRYDRQVQRADDRRRRPGPGGSWDVPGVACRTGIQIYEDERGTVRELRPEHEVMAPESLASLVGVALTLQHPGQGQDDDQGLEEVQPENYRDLTHGVVLSVEPGVPDPGLVGVWTRVQSAELQRATGQGIVELSCGYEAVLLDPWDPAHAELVARLGPEPGLTHEGERYDLIQTRIRYNHLAVVDQARAGPVARLRLDGSKMKTIKVDGKTHKIDSWLVAAVKAMAIGPTARADAGEVLEVSIEGMETMVLPRAWVEDLMKTLGTTPPPSTEPEVPAVDEAPGLEAMPIADQEPEEELLLKSDGLDPEVKKTIDAQVRRAIADAMPQVAQRITDRVTTSTRERAALDRAALPMLGQRFDFAAHDEHGIAVEVLRADESPRLAQAEQYAGLARKGDARAGGRLAEMMDAALDRRRDQQDSSGLLGSTMFEIAHQDSEGGKPDEKPSWVVKADEKRLARDKGTAAA